MQGKSPKVSVIVVNFNGKSYLEACLRSIVSQGYPDFEVILVDNNSSDGSVGYVRQRFPDVLIVENAKNLGYAAGINSGIGRASGVYFAVLNHDTEVRKDWLAPMVRFLEANPNAAAVTPKSLLYRQRERVGVMGLNVHVTGLGFVRALNRRDVGLSTAPFSVAAVSGSSFLVRREVVEKMGGLDEHNFMYYDDVDMSWLIRLMGYELYCVPVSVVYHEYTLKMSSQKLFWLEYGRWSALLSYLKPTTLILLLPMLALTEALVMGFCLRHGLSFLRAKIRASVAVLRHSGKIAGRRRKAQRLRKLSDWQLLKRLETGYQLNQVLHILR